MREMGVQDIPSLEEWMRQIDSNDVFCKMPGICTILTGKMLLALTRNHLLLGMTDSSLHALITLLMVPHESLGPDALESMGRLWNANEELHQLTFYHPGAMIRACISALRGALTLDLSSRYLYIPSSGND